MRIHSLNVNVKFGYPKFPLDARGSSIPVHFKSEFKPRAVSAFWGGICFRGFSAVGLRSSAYTAPECLPPPKNSRKAAEKYEFDNIQDLIVSGPSVSSEKNPTGQLPTLLEREAEAVDGSTTCSRQERVEAMNGLLDLLEKKGVTPGYAFEFVRYARDLIDDLIVEAKERLVGDVGTVDNHDDGLGEGTLSVFRPWPPSLKANNGDSRASNGREKRINRLLQFSEVSEVELEVNEDKLAGEGTVCQEISTLACRVSDCAEKRGLGRLVYYFQLIGMKAQNIPRVVPFVERGIDMLVAKVEFLRSVGVNYNHLLGILVKWPELLSYQCDSLAHNVDFLVGLGLAHKDIGKMIIKFPQILGRDVEKELSSSVEVLENLGIQMKDVKKLLVRYPILLTENALEKLDPIVTFLEQLGVQREHIGTLLLRRPLLLDSDVEKDLSPIGSYLKSLNATSNDIDKILMSFPQLFSYDIDKDFRPTVLYLESLGVESSLMGKLFRRHPRLLKNRHNFQLKLEFLLSLGLEQKDLGKVIYNAPQLLCLSIGDNMKPTIEFLGSMGIKGPLLLKVLKLKPMILAYSVEGKLKPNIKFLKSLPIKQAEIGKLVTRHPQLLTLSIEKNLKPTVSYLLQLGFTSAEVADMVRKLPSLLGFSVTTVLGPKYVYLVDVMHRSRKELVQFPHYFSYSLSKRIIPRHQSLGKLCDSLSLNSLYGCSDEVFEKKSRRWTHEIKGVSLRKKNSYCVPRNVILPLEARDLLKRQNPARRKHSKPAISV